MDEVSLITYLKKSPFLTQLVFPTEKERTISVEDLMKSIHYEAKDKSESNLVTANFFHSYIEEIDARNEGTVHV